MLTHLVSHPSTATPLYIYSVTVTSQDSWTLTHLVSHPSTATP